MATGENRSHVFDPLRQKSVARTPEEEVRQRVIYHFIEDLGIPKGLIAVEKSISRGNRVLRADLVVYNRSGDPWMVVECKAPAVRLAQATINQAAAYNRDIGAPYLLLTNGSDHACIRFGPAGTEYVDIFPTWPVDGQT